MKLIKEHLFDAVRMLKDYNDANIFSSPFVILVYEDYRTVYSDFYPLVHDTYGLNATFLLNNATSKYALDTYLTRAQYNTMINSGWDVGLEGWIGDLGDITSASSEQITEALQALINQKENIGIFNPVMYYPEYHIKFNTPARSVGFKLVSDTTSDNYLKKASQVTTGRVDVKASNITSCISALSTCVDNNWGVVMFISKLTDSNRTAVTTLLDAIDAYVQSNELEVLTANEYLAKYRPDICIPNNDNRNTKEFNYIMNKITG